jgi:geranylgeranyl diphosphate synthase, type II
MAVRPDVDAYIAEMGRTVTDYLATLFANPGRPVRLFEAMNYSLLGAGKRLRPILCIATAETFGVSVEKVLPAAAALELVHCYSLIHDDLPIIDNDDLRRGRPTNHKVYGDATALLAGDALLTYAFEQLSQPLCIAPDKQLQMIRTLAHAAGAYGMVGGQQADILAEHSDGDLELLQFIHVHKTAKLIQASVVIGSLFANVSSQEQDAVAKYGLSMGLAFQIVDDWLDVAGNEAEMGKPVGSDERLQKLTYPRLVGLERTRELAESTMQTGIEALAAAGIQAPLLTAIGEYVVRRTK